MGTMRPDPRTHSPTAQDGAAAQGPEQDDKDWISRAQSAYAASTSYVDSNYRKVWEDSIRAFNNQHPTDSKYNQPAYEKRSRMYRPKIRAIIRKNEAAAAAAFFSNVDVVSVTPSDQSNKTEVASAELMKQLLQYRLTKSIPWYQTLLGAFQDSQTTGVACAHIYWHYAEEEIKPEKRTPAPVAEEPKTLADALKPDEEYPQQTATPPNAVVATDGQTMQEEAPPAPQEAPEPSGAHKVIMDEPAVEVFPVENLRIDPGANWVDPINTSPYLIHLMPMYVLDVKERMADGDWRTLPDAVIGAATEAKTDTTRLARNKDRDDPYKSDVDVDDYTVVWVQRHIHRRDGQDWEFYMMGDQALLTDPHPLVDTVFHGMRPYVMGCCILETHKVFPTSVPQLGKGLQDEANEIANQRSDNVKFVLNKKWFVKRGKEADVAGLLRNVPGGVVMLDDPQTDVREVTWPDVTASAFQEQQGVDNGLDELLGNFNPASIMAQGQLNAPARNMTMLSQSNGTLVEYLIRTFTETFVLPVMRQLVLLEQQYETDTTILNIAGKKAQLAQRFGVDEVTDSMLEQELTLSVNVGMGATDPMQKLNKFMSAMGGYLQMMQKPVPGVNMLEVGKEIFGALGYNDGSRFFTQDDPQVAQLTQQLQQMQQALAAAQKAAADKQADIQAKLAIAKLNNETNLKKAQMHEQSENKRTLATHYRALMEGDMNAKHELTKHERELVARAAEVTRERETKTPALKPEPKAPPQTIHVHVPPPPVPVAQVVIAHPKRSRQTVERDANGEMTGTLIEHEA